jgi:hypothetical protein
MLLMSPGASELPGVFDERATGPTVPTASHVERLLDNTYLAALRHHFLFLIMTIL